MPEKIVNITATITNTSVAVSIMPPYWGIYVRAMSNTITPIVRTNCDTVFDLPHMLAAMTLLSPIAIILIPVTISSLARIIITTAASGYSFVPNIRQAGPSEPQE